MAKAKHTQQLDRISNNEVQLGLKTGAILSASKDAFSTNKLIRYTDDITHIESPQDLITKGYVDDAFDQLNKNITSALSIRIVPGKRINTEYNSGKETLEIALGGAYIPDFSNKFLSETKTDKSSYPVEALKAADDSYYYSYGVFTGQTDSKYGKFAASTADANAGMGAVISAIKVDKYGAVIGVDYKKISTSDLDNTGGAYDNYRAWVLNVGDQSVNVTGAANAPKDGEKPDATYGNTYELEFAGSGITPTISTSGTKHKLTFTPYLDQDYLTMVGAAGSANAKISHKLQSATGQPLVSVAKVLKGTVDAAGHITSIESVNLDDLAGDFDLKIYGTGSGESLEKGLVHGVDSEHTDNNPSTSTMFYTSNGKWAGIPYKEVKISSANTNEDAPLLTGSDDITGLKKVNTATINPSTGELKAKSFTGDGSKITNINAASITTNVLNNKVIPTIPLEKGGLGRAINNSDLNSVLAVKADDDGKTSVTSIQTDATDGGSGSTYVLTQDKKNLENIKFTSVNDLVDTELDNKNAVRIFATIGSADGSTYRVDGDGATVNLQDILATAHYKKGYLFRATSNFNIKDSDSSKEYDYKVVSGDLIYAIKDYNEAGYPKFVVTPAYKGATKTEKSDTNGNIKIDDVEYTVYELPEATNATLGGVYIDSELSTNDNEVHVPKTSVVTAKINDVETSLNTKIDDAVAKLEDKIGSTGGDSKDYVDTKLAEHLAADNPHNITATTIGLEKVVNAVMDENPTADSDNYVKSSGVYNAIADVNASINTVADNLKSHKDDTHNPHGVTAAQVGLGLVVNASMDSDPKKGSNNYVKSGGVYSSINAVDAKVDALTSTVNTHLTATNPHKVNAAQVGLGSVKNYGITKAVNDNGDSGKKDIKDSNADYSDIIKNADEKYASEGLVISYVRDIYDNINDGTKEFENLTVTGNLNVQGAVTSLETTNLEIKDQMIELDKRSDKTVPLAGYAGLYVDNYNGDTVDPKAVALAFDNTGTAYVGHAKIDENGLISNSENDLQAIATRTGFGESDIVVKYCANKKTLVPAVEGTDYLSNTSAVNADNVVGTLGSGVVYQGTPIEGTYLANINAKDITDGDLAYDRISNLVSKSGEGDNGNENVLARADHTHSDIKQMITDHEADESNPHNVTAEQVGLGLVVNASMDSDPTKGSNNYVKSGGVYTSLNTLDTKIDDAVAKLEDKIGSTGGDSKDYVDTKLAEHLAANNPHNITSATIGLEKVVNASMDAVPTEKSENYVKSGGVYSAVNTVDNKIDTVNTNLNTKIDDAVAKLEDKIGSTGGDSKDYVDTKLAEHLAAENPHNITAKTVGLGLVVNASMDSDPTKGSNNYVKSGGVYTSLNVLDGKISTVSSSLNSHLAAINPHKVNAAQVGLGSVKNYGITKAVNDNGDSGKKDIKDSDIDYTDIIKAADEKYASEGLLISYVRDIYDNINDGTKEFENLTVTGNLNVQGTTTTIATTKLEVNDQLIELGSRDNKSVPLVGYAGIYVDTYDGNTDDSKITALAFDNTGTAYIGHAKLDDNGLISGVNNGLQAIATRAGFGESDIVVKYCANKKTLVPAVEGTDYLSNTSVVDAGNVVGTIGANVIYQGTPIEGAYLANINAKDITEGDLSYDRISSLVSEAGSGDNGESNVLARVDHTHSDIKQMITDHEDNKENPHEVTAEQVGLGLVVNASMDELPTEKSDNYVKSGGVYTEFVSVNTSISTISSNLSSHTDDKNNPHEVTAEQVGLGLVINASMDENPTEKSENYVKSGGVYNSIANVNTSINAVASSLTSHTNDKNNPHNVTSSQVGLGLVVNASMDSDPTKGSTNYVKSGGVYTSLNTLDVKIGDVSSSLSSHLLAINPHKVTKDQVGLGSVKNYGITKAINDNGDSGKKDVVDSDVDYTDIIKAADEKYASEGLLISYVRDIYDNINDGTKKFDNLTVTGNLNVQGSITSLETTNLEIKDQMIELDKRSDKTVPLAGYAGLYVDTYNGDTTDPKAVALAFDANGIAYVGHAKIDDNGLISSTNSNLQAIATRAGFGESDIVVKYCANKKTFVPAVEGTDYLSNTSVVDASNISGTIGANVVYQGTPIEGTYLANINAKDITDGDLSYDRISSLVSESGVGDNGSSNILARVDHTHSDIIQKIDDHLEAENPHNITAKTVGLDLVVNASMDELPTEKSENYVKSSGVYTAINDALDQASGDIAEVNQKLDGHIKDTENPHKVTKAQVGLDKVENLPIDSVVTENSKDYISSGAVFTSVNKVEVAVSNVKSNLDTLSASFNVTASKVESHINSYNNPHNVSKAQVGLGSVENYGIRKTSDIYTKYDNYKLSSLNDLTEENIAAYDSKYASAGLVTAYAKKLYEASKGDQAFKNVSIEGNLNVKGNVTSLETSNLAIKDQLLELNKRDDKSTPLNGYAGIYVDTYNGDLTDPKATALAFDATGIAYVGHVKIDSNGMISDDENDLQILATRTGFENSDSALAKYNAANKTFVPATENEDYLSKNSTLRAEKLTGTIGASVKYEGSAINGQYLENIDAATITKGDLAYERISSLVSEAGSGDNGVSNTLARVDHTHSDIKKMITAHTEDKNNPHEVTKGQVGLGLVVNASMDELPTEKSENYVKSGGVYTEFVSVNTSINAVASSLKSHAEDKNNPHNVTASQVGLGLVVNASMDSDPIKNSNNYVRSGGVYNSIANVNASITTLENKVDTHINDKQNPHSVTKDQIGLGSVENASMLHADGKKALQNISDEDITSTDPKYASAGLVTAYAKDLYDHITGDQQFTNVVITGNLNVQGNVTSLETTNLEIKDQMIELDKRKDKSVALAGYAGLYVDTYNGDTTDSKAVALAFDSNGIAYVGHAKLDDNGLIPIDSEDNNLQPIATRKGFESLSSDVMVKYKISEKTLVPAQDGTDYLSGNSILKAENLRGVIGASVVFKGSPIDGDYLTNIDASTITRGDLDFARVESIAPARNDSDKSTVDYGVAEQLARIDHKHSEYLTEASEVELSGDVTGKGPLGKPIVTAISDNAVTTSKIADGNVTNAKIESLNPNKINAGTIGDANKIVDLYGNARTASNLSKEKSKGVLYQSSTNITDSVEGTEDQVLLQGADKPKWTDQKNIVAGSINGGKANDLLYQSDANKTSFLNAPTSTVQNTLTYSGNRLTWVNTNTLHVEEAAQAVTVCVNNGANDEIFLVGTANENGFQTPKSSTIKAKGGKISIGNNSTDGIIAVGASGSAFKTEVKANVNAMNSKKASSGLGANINVYLPSEDGNIDTVEMRNKKLEEYLPLIGGTLTGQLNINTSSPQLHIVSTSANGENKTSKITTSTYTNEVLNIVETIATESTNSVYVGGNGINGTAADSVVINIADAHDSLSKKAVATLNKSAITLGDSVNIVPGKSTNIGLSSNLVENIYAKNYFENNVNIATIYPRATVDKTGNTTPILVASEDSDTPDTVITSVSIEDGKLNYTKGILPVDDMVKQNYVNDGTLRPLLLANTNGITNESGVRTDVNYNNSIYVNPTNSELFVKTIKSSGSTPTQLFGNASTATKAAAVYDGNAETSATRVIVATSVVENRTSNSTPNTLVERDSAGDFAANNITVEELKSGKVNGKTHLIGLSDEATLAYDANNAYALKSKDGSKTRTSDVIIAELEAATDANNGGTIVKRDNKGNFSATVITAALSGNASTATKLETPRNFSVTGGATSDTVKFDGSADVNINIKTIQPNIIVSGTIGTSSARVDLVGNASTATIASNLAGGNPFSIPYQVSASTTAYIDWLKDSDLPSASSEFILLATDKTKSPKWSKNPYLHLNGVDTMTGILNVAANKNEDSYDSHAVNMNRSNIGNIHGIFFEQTYNSVNNGQETVLTAKENTVDQGIHFFRDSNHVDTLYSKSGNLLYSPNRELKSDRHTDYDVIHSGNHMKYIANVNIKDLGSKVENISNININEVGINNSQTTILSVSRGGTGVSSITKNSILVGNGTDSVQEILIGSSNQFLRVNNSTDGYEYVSLGTMAYQDTDKYKGNTVIESVGTIKSGTWNATRVAMDYLDENVNKHINQSEKKHIPDITNDGFVLISDASNNRKWTNDIKVESNEVRINKKNLTVDGNLSVGGNASITGNITLGGGITIAGSTTIVDATTLSTTDTLIELGKGNTKELTTYAGFYIPNYDGKNAGALAFDKNGIAYVGDAFINNNGFIDSEPKQYDANGKLTAGNDMRPIAVRDTSIDDNSIIKWNASTKSLVKAEPSKDYVPVAAVSAGTYYKVVTNKDGLVTSGASSLDINDKNITGNLPASRITYTASAEGAQETTVDKTLNDIYVKIKENSDVPTATIGISGDISGSGSIKEGLVLTINNEAVTNDKIKSIDPSKITTGTIGSSTAKVNLVGNAETATKATTADKVKVTSGTSGNILVGGSGDSVGLVASGISVSGSTITGTVTNAIRAGYLVASAPTSANVDIFYANSGDKTLGIQTTSGTKYALDLGAAKIVKGSTTTELITSDNVATKTLSRFRMTSKYAGSATVEVNISNNIISGASVSPVDISTLLPGDEQYNGKYVSITTSQNIPALKSFGGGLILGKDTTSGTNSAFKEDQEGCKMLYNKDKKCVQFIFQ